MKFARLVVLLLAAMLASPLTSLAPVVAQEVGPAPSARVIVGLKPGAATARQHAMLAGHSRADIAVLAQRRADALASRSGAALRAGRVLNDRTQVVFASGVDGATLAQRLRQHPDVAYAVVDERRRATKVPNDPLFAAGPANGRGPDVGQWYLRAPAGAVASAINAQGAWDLVTADATLAVAVIDTGVLADHLDLAGRVLPGMDMISDVNVANDGNGRDSDASDPGDWITAAEDASRSGPFYQCGVADSSWHGTLVSGIVAASGNNAIGMAGTAYGVRILPVRVLGKCGGFDSDIVAGMYWAGGIDQPGLAGSTTPARVLNLSLGGTGACTQAYIDVVNALAARNAVVVAAAGNSTGHATGTPANCPGVIAVAGLRHVGSKVGFSDLGPEITISAPGGNCVNTAAGSPCLYPIIATSNSGTRGPAAGGSIWTDAFNPSVGTSFSAPLVSGTVALMMSARPQITASEVIATLKLTARPFPTTGADNGSDPTPVTACHAPDGTDQLQCYCSTALCGAGMIDAAAAVAAVAPLVQAHIDLTTAAPQAGTAVQLSAVASQAGLGRSIASYLWEITSGGAGVSAFSTAVNASTVSFLPSSAGAVGVRLTVTDDVGNKGSTELSVTVASAPTVPPVGSSGGGGGSVSPLWLALLALAVAALERCRLQGSREGSREG